MTLGVPYKSQLPYEKGGGTNRKWCGIASLWMVMAYYLKESVPKIEELLEKYGADFETGGFRHKDLLKIARDYNLRGFRKSWWAEPGAFQLMEKFVEEGETEDDIKDWTETNIEESLFTLKRLLDQGIPAIISVSPEFSPSGSTHLVVITGYEDSKLLIHDPLNKGESFQIPEGEFKKYWLRQAIIVKPT